MLYRKNFSKRYKYQQHHQPLTPDSMALLLAPLLLSMLSLTTSATMDSELLDRIETGEMMDYIFLPSPPNAKKAPLLGKKMQSHRIVSLVVKD